MRRVAITLVVVLVSLVSINVARAGQQDLDRLSYAQLDRAAQKEIARGGIYGIGWGAASPWLKSICYEMVERAFTPYGNQRWATYVVNRESGCNPGAVNTTYSSWSQRARCIAQLIPYYHRWVDYGKCSTNMRYSIAVFVRLSKGGNSRGPWG